MGDIKKEAEVLVQLIRDETSLVIMGKENDESINIASSVLKKARIEWQPIETSPKDGTWVLLSGGEISDEHFEGEEPPPAVCAKWDENGYGYGSWILAYYDSAVCAIRYRNPTHWMSIPKLTKGEES